MSTPEISVGVEAPPLIRNGQAPNPFYVELFDAAAGNPDLWISFPFDGNKKTVNKVRTAMRSRARKTSGHIEVTSHDGAVYVRWTMKQPT